MFFDRMVDETEQDWFLGELKVRGTNARGQDRARTTWALKCAWSDDVHLSGTDKGEEPASRN